MTGSQALLELVLLLLVVVVMKVVPLGVKSVEHLRDLLVPLDNLKNKHSLIFELRVATDRQLLDDKIVLSVPNSLKHTTLSTNLTILMIDSLPLFLEIHTLTILTPGNDHSFIGGNISTLVEIGFRDIAGRAVFVFVVVLVDR